MGSISNPHISCCYLCKEVFYDILETFMFEEIGKGGGTREIKNAKEKRSQVEKKETKDEEKIEKWDRQERGK